MNYDFTDKILRETAPQAALCGSRWRGERRVYHADGQKFDTPEEAASSFGVSRQTVYNRAKSPNQPKWWIEVRREVVNNA